MKKLSRKEFYDIIEVAYSEAIKSEGIPENSTTVSMYAEETGLSLSGARRRLKLLVEKGILELSYKSVNGARNAVYTLVGDTTYGGKEPT